MPIVLLGASAKGVAIPGPYCLPVRTELRSRPVSFSIKAIDGSVLSFTNRGGKPAVIGFFATWCGPCREELPAFVDVAHHYEAQGFQAILVDDDEPVANVRRFMRLLKIDFPVAIDTDGSVAKMFGVLDIPASAFYNAQGVLTCYAQEGLYPKQIDNEVSAAVGGWMPK